MDEASRGGEVGGGGDGVDRSSETSMNSPVSSSEMLIVGEE